MTVVSKLRTLRWFASRPHLWGQAVELVKRKFGPDLDSPAHRRKATSWCEQNAISTDAAFDWLGQANRPYFRQLVSDEWSEAKAKAASCPVEMGGEGHLDLLHACCESVNAKSVVETGVAYGWSSYALLRSLCNRNGHLISTDMPYVQQNLEAYVGIVVPNSLRNHWTLIRQADRQGLPKALARMPIVDMCHYDSDKSYAGREWAYPLLWQSLRTGGLFVSDDIQDNEGFRHFVDRLEATDWFVTEHLGKFVGVIRKS